MGNTSSQVDITEPVSVRGNFQYRTSEGGARLNPAFSPSVDLTESALYVVPAEKGLEICGTGGTKLQTVVITDTDGTEGLRFTTEENTTICASGVKSSRSLSLGDEPYWLKRKEPLQAEESFLLGRIEGRDLAACSGETIRITEVAPSDSGIYEDDGLWRLPLSNFTSKQQGPDYKQWNKRIRSYYKAQDQMIKSFTELREKDDVDGDDDDNISVGEAAEILRQKALFYSRLSFGINFLLLIAKAVASALSGSIAIISSLVDSVVDLLSGVIIWWASKAVKKRDPYVYPQGRTKLEPVAIIVLSVIMAAASIQLIRESIEKIISLANESSGLPVVAVPTLVITGSTIVAKLVLWLLCRRVNSSSVHTLALDHRNDVCSNCVAIVCGYLGSTDMFAKTGIKGFSFVDPAGAIVISFYIIYNWWKAGAEQTRFLTGYTAQPKFLSKITWICVNHHKKIKHIETVRAFHFGNNFLVEVDIVLPETMTMKEAHNIGEPLQLKLENLPEVERAFVHLDYEFTHHPKTEHKIV